MKTRLCICLKCKHQWKQIVEYSKTTQNLSGEKTICCPKCNNKNIMAEPIKDDSKEFSEKITAKDLFNYLGELK